MCIQYSQPVASTTANTTTTTTPNDNTDSQTRSAAAGLLVRASPTHDSRKTHPVFPLLDHQTASYRSQRINRTFFNPVRSRLRLLTNRLSQSNSATSSSHACYPQSLPRSLYISKMQKTTSVTARSRVNSLSIPSLKPILLQRGFPAFPPLPPRPRRRLPRRTPCCCISCFA